MNEVEPPEPPARSPEPLTIPRLVALIEVILCSDYPTQIALGVTLHLAGVSPLDRSGRLSLGYVVALSLADTVLLVGLIVFFLRSHGERLRDVFLGPRPVAGELRLGAQLSVVALVLGIAVLSVIQTVPGLHNVARNPLQDLIQDPRRAGVFAVVVVVAGGVREEIQRAFLLHRFSVWLGGGTVGLIVGSIAFGAGHLVQGYDAVIATGVLGVFWGIIYLQRKSVVAPIVSHSGFNLLQLLQYLVFVKP